MPRHSRDKRRVATQSGLTPERFQPRASPVDTFVPARSNALQDLARGLSEFAPSLARFSDQQAARHAEQQEMEGSAAAQRLIEERQTYKEAVQEGLIGQHQDPFFRLGVKRQFATVAAQSYTERLDGVASEMLASGVTDPESFRAREAALRKEFVEETIGGLRDAGFDRFFADAVNASAHNAARQFAVRAGQATVAESKELLGAETVGILRKPGAMSTQEIVQGALALRDGDHGALIRQASRSHAESAGQQIDELARWAIEELGLSGTVVNEVIGDAIIAYAESEGDTDALLYARFVRTHGGKTLADIPSYMEKARQAVDRILNREDSELARTQARRREEALQVQIEWADEVDEKGFHNVDHRAHMLRIARIDPTRGYTPESIPQKDNSLQSDLMVDPQRITYLQAEAGVGRLTIDGLMLGYLNGIYTPTEVIRVLPYAQGFAQWQKSQMAGEDDPLDHPEWKDSGAFLRRVAGADSLFEFGLEQGREAVLMARNAERWARHRWLDYYFNQGGHEQPRHVAADEMDKILTAAQRKFFPLHDEAARTKVREAGPLNWQSPVLSGPQMRDLTAFVRDGSDMTDQLAGALLAYGVDEWIVNGADEQALDALESLLGLQERAHGLVQETQEPAPEAAPEAPAPAAPAAAEPTLAPDAVELLTQDPRLHGIMSHEILRRWGPQSSLGRTAQRVVAGTATETALQAQLQREIARLERSEQRLATMESQGVDRDTLTGRQAATYEALLEDIERLEILRSYLK